MPRTCSFYAIYSAEAISPETNTKETPNAVIDELLDVRAQFHEKARNNIHRAQQRQKEYYDARHDSNHVSYVVCRVNHYSIITCKAYKLVQKL